MAFINMGYNMQLDYNYHAYLHNAKAPSSYISINYLYTTDGQRMS